MRKINLMLSIVLLLFVLLAASGFAPANASYKKGGSFPSSKLSLKDKYYICDTANGDVNGDGRIDQVLLIGHKITETELPYTDKIKVAVVDGKSGKMNAVKMGEMDAGYKPVLFLGDFNGDRIRDIFINVDLGGSGGVQADYILSFKGGSFKQIFNGPRVDPANYLTAKFIDGFKTRTTSSKYKINEVVSVSANKQMYIENGYFTKSGKLLKEMIGVTDGFGLLQPVLLKNGIYGLEGSQRIWSFVHADTIADVNTSWKYDRGVWKLTKVQFIPMH